MCAHVLLWQATAAEVGLDAPPFTSETGCDVQTTRSADFDSSEEMISHFVASQPHFFDASAPGSRLLCRFDASHARVGPYDYDRRSNATCAPGASFREGDNYTFVGFFGRHPENNPAPMVMANPDMFGMSGERACAHARTTEDTSRASRYFLAWMRAPPACTRMSTPVTTIPASTRPDTDVWMVWQDRHSRRSRCT